MVRSVKNYSSNMVQKGKNKPSKSSKEKPKKKVKPAKKADETLLFCMKCKQTGDSMSHMWVQCDKCDRVYHFTCVGITEIGEEDPWICSKCESTGSTERSESQGSKVIPISDNADGDKIDSTNITIGNVDISKPSTQPSVQQEIRHQKSVVTVPVVVHERRDINTFDLDDDVYSRALNARTEKPRGNPGVARGHDAIEVESHSQTNSKRSFPASSTRIDTRISDVTSQAPFASIPFVKPMSAMDFRRKNDEGRFKSFLEKFFPNMLPRYTQDGAVQLPGRQQYQSSVNKGELNPPITSEVPEAIGFETIEVDHQAPIASMQPEKPMTADEFRQRTNQDYIKAIQERHLSKLNPSQAFQNQRNLVFQSTEQTQSQSLFQKDQPFPAEKSKATEVHKIPSVRSEKSRVQSEASRTSSKSSQLRRDLEYIRIQEELELQTKLDEEKLKLERDAFALKEKREKKFLEDKYKLFTENDGSSSTRSSKAASQATKRSQESQKSSLIEKWIEGQRQQNAVPTEDQSYFHKKIDEFNYDTSIPVYSHEWYQLIDRANNNQNVKNDDGKQPLTSTGTKKLNPNARTFQTSDQPIEPSTGQIGNQNAGSNPLPNLTMNPNYPPMYTDFSGIPQLNVQPPGQNIPPGTQQAINNQRRSMLTSSQIAARHAVPKELPKFNGNPAAWPRFIRKFVNTTRMCGLTDDENIERLDKCLEGKARTIVESQLAIPDCVREIIETLREKFGRPELVVNAILAELRKVQAIKPDKIEALSDFGYQVRNACRTIESLGLQFYLYNPELVREIVEKLPCQTRIEWARHSEQLQQITLGNLSDWMYGLARTLNRITTPEVIPSSYEKKSERKSDNTKVGQLNYHEKSSTSQAYQSTPKCPSCSRSCNNVGECSTFKGLAVDDRWALIMDRKLCRKCLQKHGRKCPDTKFRACGVSGCELKHNSLLHNKERHSRFETKSDVQKSKQARNQQMSDNQSQNSLVFTSKPSNTHQASCESELFRIVPVILNNNGISVKTFAFLDEGSSYTLMEKEIANKLKVEGIAETICLLWTNGIHRQEETLKVNLQIRGTNKTDEMFKLRAVNVVEDLGLSPQSVDPGMLGAKFKYLRNLPLQKYTNAIPTILIGLRHIHLTTPLESIEGGENEPIASRSRLGWTIYGPTDGVGTSGYANHHKVSKCPCGDRDDELHKMVKEHFTIENFGVSVNSSNLESKENKRALEMLEKFTIRKGNRFETRLLWKNEAYKLPDSYGMACKRLKCVENKGAGTVNLINGIIDDYIAKGYASKLTPADLETKHDRTFYLPIFTVINPKKPGKIRPVFDAAATVQGTSLNSTLLTGPDQLSPLVDILRRFREHKIAVTGDIKEMYHQVLINEEDRHSQRFLWRNGEKNREPDVYQFNVMTFGSKCSPSSAQFVKNINAAEYEVEFPRASKSIIKNHYVDDMLDGTRTVQEAIELINDVKLIHSKAGFEIRNFKSNSSEVLRAVGEQVEASKVDLVEENGPMERVLGMFWETNSDCFMYSLKFTKIAAKILEGKLIPTKRELLRLVMSLFDPLGLISYYVIHARCLLQDVWRSKIDWDEKLPEDLSEKWYRWVALLPNVEKLKIPRWYTSKLASESIQTNELHIFVDAGDEAFAAVAYLRVVDNEGVDCSLIGSKARVTPLKYFSTPRKELMGGVLGSRLVNSVEQGISLTIDRRIIWTDSITVLTWLHSEQKKYSQFVAHRIGEILENTNLSEWRWVPTKMNVADEATKWSKKPTFEASDRWFRGPEFLRYPESEWPVPKAIIPNSTNKEMKPSCSHSKLLIDSIVKATDFSTWQRLVRAVANAKRIASWWVAKQRKLLLPSLKLSQEDLVESERRLIRQAQWEDFTEEMVILTRNKSLNPKKQKSIRKGSSIKDCSPYLDELGILRVKGRIDSATAVTMDAKRPIILPKNNPITALIVRSVHVKFKHHSHESVINELRQKYYIPQIRTVLRGVRWSCKLCEIRRCKPQPPQMADLPAIRFEAGIRPFTYTGIDYFGPLSVKVGRQTHKRWGVLYTCLTIRAVYIDVVPNYDTTSCILSIRDFINRKGVVQQFYTDNGTYFKGADNELERELRRIDQQKLSDEFTSCYTKWNFNPPETPHMGGTWERLIGAVKISLYESMITRTPTEQMLRSWLIEAENIVNSRPLTFVPLESEEDEALTPNHFIHGSSNGIKPPGNFKSDGPFLRHQWKEVQRCADRFWKRFIHEYVPTLIRKTKWFDQVKPLEVGDIVIDFDEDAPRNTYKRARVVETIVGSNQQVRRAKVQFGNGSTLWRSAHHLGLLDVKAPTESIGLDHPDNPKDDKNRGEIVGAENTSVEKSKSLTSKSNEKMTGNGK